MAYTPFDLTTVLKLQKSLAARRYSHTESGTKNSDFLYGDHSVSVDSITGQLVANDRILAGEGDDVLYGGIGNDSLSGDNGNDFLEGGNGNDLLLGGKGNDIVHGGNGADYLDGGIGIDEMRGGLGEDTYVIDNIADRVIETDDDETDTVLSSVSFTLGDKLENLILTGSAKISATGNDLDNVLYGNSGLNTLAGGDGNDHYYVQNTADVVNETSSDPNAEWNIVFSSATFTLTAGSEIDEFILTGSAAIKAYGNEQDNLIEGNAGSNALYGADGNDTLSGVPLDVTVASDNSHWSYIVAHLSENQGTDVLYGGKGDDLMFLGKTDRIVESANEGIDTAVCGYSHVLEANVENLDFYGKLGSTNALVGTGNTLNNLIISNLGADTLAGKTGDDTYEVFNSAIVVKESTNQGHDTVWAHVDFKLANNVEDLVLMPTDSGFTPLIGLGNTLDNGLLGNDADNVLDGQGGNDTLYGGEGNDQLTGGSGADIFVFDSALNATTNVDSIHDFLSGQDTIELDADIFSAFSVGGLAATDFLQGSGAGSAPTQTANGEHILFDTDTGTLFYDADGAGVGLATAFAVLNPLPTGYLIASTDFLVIA